LGSYLAAVGALRLVGAQADAGARGYWANDTFILATTLGRDALHAFFIDQYCPTPLVAPWNGGSGFAPNDKKGSEAVSLIERSVEPRLAPYRAAIAAARLALADAERLGLRRDKEKDKVVNLCRGRLPDAALDWIDAAVVLTSEGPKYPPLLGTGGNFGRLEVSATFMHRVADVLGLRAGRRAPRRPESSTWLDAALFATAKPVAIAPVGQFDPGGADRGLVNPWSFVLLIEGALVFASGAARRLSSSSGGKAAMPFMVDASPVGFDSGADEPAKGEVWAPLWSRPANAAELTRLIGEGRAEWRGRQARRGVDMALAVGALGVDRGVTTFVRHGIIERFGQSPLAIPLGRLHVRHNEAGSLLKEVDAWLDPVRGASDPPAAVRVALRAVEAAMYSVARTGAAALADVLGTLAGLEAAVGRSRKFRDRARARPIEGLTAVDWLPHLLAQPSVELRLAAVLASLHDRPPAGGPIHAHGPCLRLLLRPVAPADTRLQWSQRPVVGGLGVRELHRVLASALAARVLEAQARAETRGDEGSPAVAGVRPAYDFGLQATASDVGTYLAGEIDDHLFAELIAGLLLLDWRRPIPPAVWPGGPAQAPGSVAPAWALLAPFFHGRPLAHPAAEVDLRAGAAWASQLGGGQVEPVLADALRRLRISCVNPIPAGPAAISEAAPDPARLAAALLIPLTRTTARALLLRVAPPPLTRSQPTDKE
ncbi:MAG: type I-G CRISPR-associated protein Cas8g1/Csx17, partial [Acidimicrobiales bacterium]